MKDYGELYISVDIETTGKDVDRHDIYEIGACIVGQPNEYFFRKLRLVSDDYEPEALSSCGRTIEELRAIFGMEPREAMKDFAVWLSAVVAEQPVRRSPVFVGFNAPFDWKFIDTYFMRHWGSNPFGYTCLDVKAYYMGLARCRWRDTRSSKVHPIFQPDMPHTHNALDDAREQAGMFEKMLDFAAANPVALPPK